MKIAIRCRFLSTVGFLDIEIIFSCLPFHLFPSFSPFLSLSLIFFVLKTEHILKVNVVRKHKLRNHKNQTLYHFDKSSNTLPNGKFHQMKCHSNQMTYLKNKSVRRKGISYCIQPSID